MDGNRNTPTRYTNKLLQSCVNVKKYENQVWNAFFKNGLLPVVAAANKHLQVVDQNPASGPGRLRTILPLTLPGADTNAVGVYIL